MSPHARRGRGGAESDRAGEPAALERRDDVRHDAWVAVRRGRRDDLGANLDLLEGSVSGNQIDNLGKRLARKESISDEDYRLLAQVADAWQAVLDQVEVKLQAIGFQATTRVKTTGTLRDKLRRPGAPMLKDIHDLAGARIVVNGDRIEQDEAGARIREAFADCPKPPLVVDRRKNPSFGYRALHIVVFPEKIPVEIQIRTRLQDGWAQIVESLGDSWGRGIRYGSGPGRC